MMPFGKLIETGRCLKILSVAYTPDILELCHRFEPESVEIRIHPSVVNQYPDPENIRGQNAMLVNTYLLLNKIDLLNFNIAKFLNMSEEVLSCIIRDLGIGAQFSRSLFYQV
jgi:hypothetical protein